MDGHPTVLDRRDANDHAPPAIAWSFVLPAHAAILSLIGFVQSAVATHDLSPECDPKRMPIRIIQDVRNPIMVGRRLRPGSGHSRNKIRKGTPEGPNHDGGGSSMIGKSTDGAAHGPALSQATTREHTMMNSTTYVAPRSAPAHLVRSFTVHGRMGSSYTFTCKRQSNDPSTPYNSSGLGSQILACKLTVSQNARCYASSWL
jgi:hypothetical protein